ncbi:MAG: hypothetical protein EXR68_07480 [Dehalococcoidia bacterium]|nr:hypothetical protein [Dehalococcoidia bacterium]
MQRLLTNLEERLRPLNEYTDGEEANLDALEHRMNDSGSDHAARSFAEYLAEQRDTVEVALSRFDGEMDALEANLGEQRKVMLRMLDAMRSETFTTVKEFLVLRQEALTSLAASGSTDPAEIGRSVQQLRRALEPMADAAQARPVLERVDLADRHLVSASPASPRPCVVAAGAASRRDQSPENETDADGVTA